MERREGDMVKEEDVKLVGCSMRMELVGVEKEEVLNGMEYGGVGAYLGDGEIGDVNLFI
ncbi:DsrE/DsrF/DrsH-like family protein [Siminovitchia fortis]|uniref:DsrE/DsrF/DrsH-like family protein n=1 Tax=Siminovitchia fortis TaxID=254758 RepID=UPI0021B498C2|nr:DsrE/DsrF/DrsH-like family protein [Siminovitchia fortis]